jgi:hypothetical protein
MTLLAPLLAALALGEPPLAPAESQTEDAKTLYTLGMKNYNLSDYDAAIDAFKRTYLLTQAPELLYDIAQSHRLAGPGHCTQAIQAYRSFLRESPATSKRVSVETAIRDLEPCAQKEVPPALTTEPIAPKIDLVASPPPLEATRSARVSPWIYDTVGGAGLAMLIAGGGLLIWSHSDYVSLQQSGCAPSCSTSSVQAGSTGQIAGGTLVGVGAAAVGAAVVLFLVGRGTTEPALPTDGSPARISF